MRVERIESRYMRLLACCQNEQKVRNDEERNLEWAKRYASHSWQWKLHMWSKLSFSYYTGTGTHTHTHTHTLHLTAKKWHVNCSRWLKSLTAIQSKRENSTMDDRNLSYCQSCRARQGGSAAALFQWIFTLVELMFLGWLARWKKNTRQALQALQSYGDWQVYNNIDSLFLKQ